jgi:orotate phosphoribosyltransferase
MGICRDRPLRVDGVAPHVIHAPKLAPGVVRYKFTDYDLPPQEATMTQSPMSRFESGLLREEVFNLIKRRSFSFGTFILASGKESGYYLDMKPTLFDPEGASKLSDMILQRLRGLNVDYVGGLEMGAVPLISAITMLSFKDGRPIPGFFVRKEVKDHGTKKKIDGLAKEESLAGKRVVILEDVTTTGGSSVRAVEAAQADGATVVLVLSVVDREEGAAEFYKALGIPFEALFVASEFMAA